MSKLILPAVKWQTISALDGNYLVSTTGQIAKINNDERKLMSPHKKNGYRRLRITINFRKYTFLVHRLVAEAFIENPEKKPNINHKNGIKHDNRVENLEWCTQAENVNHAQTILQIKMGRKLGSKYPDSHPTPMLGKKADLSPFSLQINQYSLAGELIQTHVSIRDAANKVNVSEVSIWKALNGQRRKSAGFLWAYSNERRKSNRRELDVIQKDNSL